MARAISYQNVIENLTTAIVLLDESFKVHYINASAEVVFDISQRQAEHIPFQAILPGEDALFKSLILVQETGQELIEREIKLYIPAYGEQMFDCAIKLIETSDYKQTILLEFYQLDVQQRISRDESLHAQAQVVRGLAHEIKKVYVNYQTIDPTFGYIMAAILSIALCWLYFNKTNPQFFKLLSSIVTFFASGALMGFVKLKPEYLSLRCL